MKLFKIRVTLDGPGYYMNHPLPVKEEYEWYGKDPQSLIGTYYNGPIAMLRDREILEVAVIE